MPEGRSASVARGFLFADLRNYSAWVEAHGDHAAAELLRAYRTLVRAAVAEFDGAEIRTEGDSFYVAFGSPSAAIMCGLRILELARQSDAADGGPIPVGIGIHAGETVQTDEGYVGSAVNIAARVCAQAGAGELIVSDSVRSLTRTYLDLRFVPLRRRHLKGITESIRLYRVEPQVADLGTARSAQPRTMGVEVPLTVALIGVPLVVLAAVVLGGGFVRDDGSAAPSGGGTLSAIPTRSADLSSTPSTGAVPSSTAFPTSDESRLLARLEDGVERHCRRADPVDVPTFEDDPTIIPLPHDAGLECRLGSLSEPDTVWFWSAVPGQRIELVSGIFFQAVGRRSIPPGDCATEDLAYGRWEFGSEAGDILCYGSRNATLMWTYDDENLLAIAVRSDGNMRALYAWWREHARLLGS